MKISREVKTAVLVIAGITFCIYLFTFLKGEDLFDSSNTYYTEFDYNALKTSSPVTIKGNKVGEVEEIKYDFESGKTRISFSVTPKLKFSKNSIVRLYQEGLMGGNALSIVQANDGELAQPGDFIKSEVKPGMISSLEKNFSGISEDLGTTLRSSDTLITNLNKLVVDESEDGLQQTIAELNATLKTFKGVGVKAGNVLSENDEKIASVLENFDKTSAELAILIKDLNDAKLSNTVKNLDDMVLKLNQLVSGLAAGEGSMGKLLNDNSLYDNLDAASKELQLLLLDIKLHPARYRRILSKREIPYEEPTQEQLNNN
ncbi:MlaD family protein [Winogradskyella sediminis]|uniref:Phospholipid/cholesterol/gamma-HCH transport system substrate-binding protein n=1 Tax=Winogradskyella sediminis TaxID=1382466 RepID=A0A1H1M186_9FLAO|nr:MlaD family protein [Winogradskyella sediminis]REG85992.1 phospholipid/cholesterol/gamma-HCH transport system substrate-binding protein [Winogradskyella sediminis]SDR80618.1 phospholipid/cholesterol/gamma-HCH transport system substrate-binding protein [Winogradskyella sediminis]